MPVPDAENQQLSKKWDTHTHTNRNTHRGAPERCSREVPVKLRAIPREMQSLPVKNSVCCGALPQPAPKKLDFFCCFFDPKALTDPAQ